MRLLLGPIVGSVSDSEARIWVRADDPAQVRIHVFRPTGTEVPGSPFTPTSDPADTSGCATAEIPLPAGYTHYTYDIRDTAGATILPAWLETPSFWSAPKPDTLGDFRFGLVSCNDMRVKRDDPERPWRTFYKTADDLDLAFLLCVGDQVYADDAWEAETRRDKIFPPRLQRAYQDVYQVQWDYRWFRRTLANLPTYMTWDDHEICNSWGSDKRDGTTAKRQAALREVRKIYRYFQHAHNPPSFGGSPDDLFYAFRYGDVGFLVLDGRGARDCNRSALPLLGQRQWTAIERWLRDETPKLGALFVASSVPPVHVPPELAKPAGVVVSDIRDQWTWPGNLPELERLVVNLFDRANEHDIPIVLLGGDVHLGTIASVRSARPGHERRPVIYQLCSSPITNEPPALLKSVFEQIKNRDFDIADGIVGKIREGPVAVRNFGVVELVHDADRYLITLKLIDENGAEAAKFFLG